MKKEDKIEPKTHLEAFDRAISLLNKYDHGRCDIYHTGDKVYFICVKSEV